MHMNKAIAAAILAFCASSVIAAPLPQLAGEGAAANSIISDTDNGVGYGTENALDNLAGNVATLKGAAPAARAVRRQLGGEGAAADSIISDTDNGVGYGTENVLDALAGNVATLKGTAPAARAIRRQLGGEGAAADSIISDTDNGVGYGTENVLDALAGNVATLKGSAPARRQLDKISNGVATLSNAAGTGALTSSTTTAGDNLDGELTSGAANLGADAGTTEEQTLEDAGSATPKSRRQLDKISNGVATLSNAAGTGAATSSLTTAGDNLDGELTSGAANLGADAGTTEEQTLEDAGSAVPKFRRQLDKISNGVATLSNAAGTGAATSSTTTAGDNLDGELTSGAANLGADAGTTEEQTLEDAGSATPKL
jgi:HPt (histidine-containing phosphotransfer) domain-containing protein